jgi:hypothetical protein
VSGIAWPEFPWMKHMIARLVLFAVLSLGSLFSSAGSLAAPNYTDAEKECINVCRERDSCFGGPGARDNSPRCKRCVAACAAEKQKASEKK